MDVSCPAEHLSERTMKPSELKNESLESLLAIYEQAALGWLKALRDHPYDPDPANQLFDVMEKSIVSCERGAMRPNLPYCAY